MIDPAKRYLPALAIQILLTAFAVIFIFQEIKNNEINGSIINISGKQRAYSRMLMIHAQTFLFQKTKNNESLYQKTLSSMIDRHENLLLLVKDGYAKEIYFKSPGLDEKLRNFILLHQTFLKSPSETFLQKIQLQMEILYPILDQAVTLHEENHTNKIKRLKTHIIFIYILFLLLLLAEVYFIFRPAANEIKEKTEQINNKNQELNLQFDELAKLSQTLEVERMKYKSLMDYSSDGIFIMGFDGSLWESSLQAANMLGYSEEEMKQLKVTDWDVGIPAEKLPELIQSVSETPIKFETKHKRKDGSTYDANITAVKITLWGTSYLYAAVRDITEEKNIRQKLLDTKSMLDNAQRIAQIGSWKLDLKSNVLHWSDEIFHIFEIDPNKFEPSYEGFLNAIHPDDVEMVNQTFSESVKNKTAYTITHRLKMKDGRIKYVREQGKTEYDKAGEPIVSSGTVQDITSLYKAELEIDQYLNLMDENIITSRTDLKGKITNVSKAFCEISGYSKEELIGRSHNIVRHPDMSQALYKELWSTISQDKTWVGEIKNLKKDGSYYWVKASISPVYNDEKIKVGYAAIRQDITDKKKVEELAVTDSLTQIYNRIHLEFIYKLSIQNSQRYGYPLSVILLDVDHFKSVNDTYGHQVGDLVLKETAVILKQNVRQSDTLGRWGGEEFLIIAPQTDMEGAIMLAEKLRSAIENFNFTSAGFRTASFGVSCYHNGDTEESLFKRTDEALYLAKKNGRNRVEMIEAQLNRILG